MRKIIRVLLLCLLLLVFPAAAQAAEGEYTIEFYMAADSDTPDKTISARYGSEVTMPKDWFGDPEQTVVLWSTDPEGDGENYLPGDVLIQKKQLKKNVLKLYATTVTRTYNIKFSANGGSGTMSNRKNISYTKKTRLPACTFTRKGYTFTGWNTKADGSGKAYGDRAYVKGLTKTHKKTVTLYARWQVNTYTLRFMPNGGLGAGISDKKLSYTKYITLPENPYIRPGYEFSGWCTAKDPEKGRLYQPGDRVRKLTAEQGAVVKLYAVWKGEAYTIAFGKNGATTGSMKSLAMETDKTAALSNCKFVRHGYIFTGWNTKKDGSGTAYENGAEVKNICPHGKTKVWLYAQWIPGVKQSSYEHVSWFHKGKTVRTSGCGISCLSYVLSRYNYRFVTPDELVQYGKEHGGCDAGYCTVHDLGAFKRYAKAYGCRIVSTGSGPSGYGTTAKAAARIKEALGEGYLVIGQMTQSGWTKQGHYVTYCGVNADNETYVYTSADVDGSKYYKYESGYYGDKIAFGALDNFFIIGPAK